MAIPQRMNLVPVQIKQLDTVAIKTKRLDPDFDEPQAGQNKIYETVLDDLKAQIVYNKKDEREVALTGDPGTTVGHLCFRRKDLTSKGIILNKGDIITFIESFAVNYKIIEVRPSGHLRGKANLILAFFEPNEETNPSTRR